LTYIAQLVHELRAEAAGRSHDLIAARNLSLVVLAPPAKEEAAVPSQRANNKEWRK
jgi:hypothetical protein